LSQEKISGFIQACNQQSSSGAISRKKVLYFELAPTAADPQDEHKQVK
jgi:hypothetical protein